jgi:hypothetical protein
MGYVGKSIKIRCPTFYFESPDNVSRICGALAQPCEFHASLEGVREVREARDILPIHGKIFACAISGDQENESRGSKTEGDASRKIRRASSFQACTPASCAKNILDACLVQSGLRGAWQGRANDVEREFSVLEAAALAVLQHFYTRLVRFFLGRFFVIEHFVRRHALQGKDGIAVHGIGGGAEDCQVGNPLIGVADQADAGILDIVITLVFGWHAGLLF